MDNTLKEWGKAAIEAFVVLLLMFVFLWPVHIDGISMENTMSDGDGVMMSRVCAWTSRVDKGDILVFRYEENGKDMSLVKRVIAMGGDTIKIKDNVVSVNGVALQEDYIKGNTLGELEQTIPDGEFFLMGDNREDSYDSRYMGTIPKNRIEGKVLFRWFPVSKIGGFE